MPARCPICAKPASADYRPFCSKRCADVDLQRWLVGRYAIPAAREDSDDDDEIRPPTSDGDPAA
jgi:endogenous inhibitor of DNA gyrase (YacG/DUF329 family)